MYEGLWPFVYTIWVWDGSMGGSFMPQTGSTTQGEVYSINIQSSCKRV